MNISLWNYQKIKENWIVYLIHLTLICVLSDIEPIINHFPFELISIYSEDFNYYGIMINQIKWGYRTRNRNYLRIYTLGMRIRGDHLRRLGWIQLDFGLIEYEYEIFKDVNSRLLSLAWPFSVCTWFGSNVQT